MKNLISLLFICLTTCLTVPDILANNEEPQLYVVDNMYLSKAQFDSCKLTNNDIVKQEVVKGRCLVTDTKLPVIIEGETLSRLAGCSREEFRTIKEKKQLIIIEKDRLLSIERRYDTINNQYKNGYLYVTLNAPKIHPQPHRNRIRIICGNPVETIEIVDYLHLTQKQRLNLGLEASEIKNIDHISRCLCFDTNLLIVVDGKPYDSTTKPLLAKIDNDQIESITKIDKATATELFGKNMENGAIIVSLNRTKRRQF